MVYNTKFSTPRLIADTKLYGTSSVEIVSGVLSVTPATKVKFLCVTSRCFRVLFVFEQLNRSIATRQ
jgi:hypothetical protein